MYDLPDMEHKGRHVVTADVVRGKRIYTPPTIPEPIIEKTDKLSA